MRFWVTLLFLTVITTGVGCADKDDKYRSGWKFEIVFYENDETHRVTQYLSANKVKLKDIEYVSPVYVKFINKLKDGMVLFVGAHTGPNGSSGMTAHVIEVAMNNGQYILKRGHNVYDGSSPVTKSELMDHLQKSLEDGVSAMVRQEEIDEQLRNRRQRECEQKETQQDGQPDAASRRQLP